MPLLALVLTSLVSSLLARVLLGAGLTVITHEWVSDVFDQAVNDMERSLNSLPDFSLSLLKLLEVDVCISMILSTVQMVLLIKSARFIIGKVS